MSVLHGSCFQLFRSTTPPNGDRDSGFARCPLALSVGHPLRTSGANVPALFCTRGRWEDPGRGGEPPEADRPLFGTPMPPSPPPQRAHRFVRRLGRPSSGSSRDAQRHPWQPRPPQSRGPARPLPSALQRMARETAFPWRSR